MDHPQHQQQQYNLRNEAIIRQTIFTHPEIKLRNEPINAKQAAQLHHRLKGLLVTKIDEVKGNSFVFDEMQKYEEIYAANFELSVKDQIQDVQICRDIQQMHNMADILLHPPDFSGELSLWNRSMPNYMQRQEIDKIFNKYEDAYKNDDTVDDDSAQDAIRRAKKFLLKDFDE